MFEKLRSVAPIWENLFWALALAGLVFVMGVLPEPVQWGALLQKMAFVAGGVLVFADVIDGAALARRGKPRWSVPAVMHGATVGCFWSWAMCVMLWSPQGQVEHADIARHFAIWIGAGVLFSAVMIMIPGDYSHARAREAHYDLDRPMTRTTAGRLFYYASLPMGLVFIGAILVWPPANIANIAWLWFALLLIWSSAPLYPVLKEAWWRAPRPYGLVLVLAALLAGPS